MRKIALILLLLPALAHAQYSGSYLPKSGGTLSGNLGVTGNLTTTGAISAGTDVNVTGNVNVKGTLSSTANIQPASPTNSGVALGASPSWSIASFYDQTQTANNRTAQILGINSGMTFRFVNDAGSSPVNWLIASGGAGSGITGITSNSGTGSWTHTGDMAVSGRLIAGSGSVNVYSADGTAVTTPHVVTGTVTLASGAGTATFTGNAVFSSTTSYNCTATDTTSNSAVKATPASASSVSFSGATTDVIAYQCIGN
jgi:hypothetical protein